LAKTSIYSHYFLSTAIPLFQSVHGAKKKLSGYRQISPLLRKGTANQKKTQNLGENSQNFLSKFVRIFVTLRCFYKAIIHAK